MSYKVPTAPLFVEAEHIEVQVDIEICTHTPTGQRLCFPPHDPFAPPAVADHPYTHSGKMLAGLRVSSSLMNGISWAMGNSDLFVTVQDIIFLDADLSFNISWAERNEPPVLKVPDDDRMEFEWSNGFVRVQCHSMPSTVDMLDFRWTELLGNGTFNHTLGGCNEFNAVSCECAGHDPDGLHCRLRDKCVNFDDPVDCDGAAPLGRCVWSQGHCMANTCAFPQVSWFDTRRSELQLVSPQLPVPDQLLTEAMESALQSGKGQLNEELQQNGMCLPKGIAKYLVPPPTVHMFKQHTAEHPDHGFLELVSFCGNGAGQQPCLAHRTYPASGRGGTDCLDTIGGGVPAVVSRACIDGLTELAAHECSPSSSAEACKPLAEEVSTQCSSSDQESELALPQIPEEPSSLNAGVYSGSAVSEPDTYIASGVVYSVGTYAAVVGESCVASCTGLLHCPKDPGNKLCCLDEQRFQNDKCSGFSVKTCVGGTYVERTYTNFNCTGEITSNRSVAAGVCTTTVVPLSNHNVSMQVICPRVVHGITQEPDHTLVWVLGILFALAGLALCAGCVVMYSHSRGTAEAIAGKCRGVADVMGAVYEQAVEYWQPVRAASGRCLEATGEVCSGLSAQAATCCTLCTANVTSWAGRWYADAVRVCTFLRGLSYNPRKFLGIHDWIHVFLMLVTAVGYATHLLLWHTDDPFAAFDRNVISEVGLDDNWVDAVPVQNHFSQWSAWGQRCQAWACVVIVVATAIGLIDQVTPKLRSTMWTAALAVVMISQVSVMLVPSFLFEFNLELFYNANHSFTSDPKTKSEADGALSLAFDGVALTFVSTLFVFMLHGLAPVSSQAICRCSFAFDRLLVFYRVCSWAAVSSAHTCRPCSAIKRTRLVCSQWSDRNAAVD